MLLLPTNNGEYVIHWKHFTIQFSNFCGVLTKELNFTYTVRESMLFPFVGHHAEIIDEEYALEAFITEPTICP